MYSNNADQAFGFAGLRHYVCDIEAVIARCRTAESAGAGDAVDASLIAEIWDEEPSLHVPAARARSDGQADRVMSASTAKPKKPRSAIVPVTLSVAAIVVASAVSVSVLNYFEPSDIVVPETGSLQLTEDPPPVGRGLLLKPPQIRYCIAQGIRLGAATELASDLSAEDAAELESRFADYDDRCAEYRFQAGAFDAARRDVETRRAALEHEGSLMLQVAAKARQSAESTVISMQERKRGLLGEHVDVSSSAGSDERTFDRNPRKIVKDLQWRLFKLKYYSGPIDGVDSPATQKALTGFFSVHDDAAGATDERTIFDAVDAVYQQR